MRVLFDSNVIIDAISDRENSNAGAQALYLKAVGREIEGYLVSKQITDIVYVLRKYVEKKKIKAFALFLCRAFSIIPFVKDDMEKAADISGNDFEDDILISVAQNNGIDCIVTNNVRDFAASKVMVLSPDDLLKKI